MDVMDIVRCFMVNSFFSTLGREIINGRLNYILDHIVGSKSRHLHATLDSTHSILLVSAMVDILLYGTSSILQHELRIATPNYAKEVIAEFFRDLSFIVDKTPTFYMPPSVICVYDHAYIQKDGKKVVLINSPTDSVMPVVLAHHSSMDCMFLATGGLFLGYPELMDSTTTLLPLAHPRGSLTSYMEHRSAGARVTSCAHPLPFSSMAIELSLSSTQLFESSLLAVILLALFLNAFTRIATEGRVSHLLFNHQAALIVQWDEDFSVASLHMVLGSPNSCKLIAINLSLLDLHNLSKTCKTMCRIVATIHNEAYLDLLRPYAGDGLDDFEATIAHSGGVIIRWGALSLILHPNSWKVNNLNIVVPRGAVDKLQHWLLHHVFGTQPLHMMSNAPSMRNFVNSHQTLYKCSTPDLLINLTESVDDTVISVVLAGRSTMEMSYVTPGGIFCSHPRLTLDHVVCPGFLSKDEKMIQDEIEWYTDMGLLYGEATAVREGECHHDCPTLWRNVNDTKQVLLIDWTINQGALDKHSPLWHTNGQHHYWRLNQSCHNSHCSFRLHTSELLLYSPADYEDILRAKVSMAVNPLLGGGHRGVLYATSCGCPILVPVTLMIEMHELMKTDHLFTEPWVNEFGRDANQTPLPFRLVVCHENHTQSRKNYLLSALGNDIAGFGKIFMPYGNILVLKMQADNPGEVMDVNPSDMELIMNIVLSMYRTRALQGVKVEIESAW
ncbi:uncharacterized protein F5891DRAFT_1195433 [Suillus fuscotomentosus]|uniref:Uncharacterized protein n=1 Tax=Suillus fuscotomentosus TaxID=1912939 RepID=A0AAD4HF75_9AGAM|nr:uncharacterized protein F5891DRAFT_1195433 [Suillus fuscotomentosus]KAG1894297.1 hypothetical protein F5891DRAFT_1195433 [Suillus fuscotomentosus]